MFAKVVIFLGCAFLGFGDMFSAAGVWSVADYLEGSRCPEVMGPYSNCCMSCLDFSPIEYGIFAMPDWFTIPIALFTSFFIDYFGFGPFGIGIGLIGVIGSLLRVSGSYLYSIHSLSYAMFLIGQIFLMGAMPMSVAVRNVAINHFYQQPIKNFVIGAGFSLSMLGGFLVFLFGHHFTETHTLDNFLWLCTIVNLLTPLCCLVLYALKNFGGHYKEIRDSPPHSLENSRPHLNGTLSRPRTESTAHMKDEDEIFVDAPRRKKRLFDFSGFKELGTRFWLALFALSSIKVCTLSLGSISILQQMVVFKIDPDTASFNFAMHYGAKVIAGPIVGIFTSTLNLYGPVGIVGYILSVVGFAFMTFAMFDPLVGLLLSGIGHVGVYSALWGVITDWIPKQHIGLAFSLNMVVICCGISILTTLSGFLRSFLPNPVMAWSVHMLIQTIIVVMGFIFCLMLNIIDFRSTKSSLYPMKNKKPAGRVEVATEETSLLMDSDKMSSYQDNSGG